MPTRSGRIAEGIPLLEQALSASEAMRYGLMQPLFLLNLGEAYALADRLEDALACAGALLTLARESGRRGYEATALWLLGDVTARRDPPRKLMATTVRRSRSPRSSGCGPSSPTATSASASSTRRTGKREQAQEHVATATTMYRDMGMTYWLEQAEAAGPRVTGGRASAKLVRYGRAGRARQSGGGGPPHRRAPRPHRSRGRLLDR